MDEMEINYIMKWKQTMGLNVSDVGKADVLKRDKNIWYFSIHSIDQFNFIS